MRTVLSNENVSLMRDQVRESALSSFSFFANTVMGSNLDAELCEEVQEAVEERQDAILRTASPRKLATALYAWLLSRGISVVSSARIPQHEVLHWLELVGASDGEAPHGCVIEILNNEAVKVVWIP